MTVDTFGKLGVVANVTGVFPKETIDETPSDDWQRTFDVNVSGIYHVVEHAIPHPSDAPNGRILSITSQLVSNHA